MAMVKLTVKMLTGVAAGLIQKQEGFYFFVFANVHLSLTIINTECWFQH